MNDADLLSQNPGNDPIQDGRVMGNAEQKTAHQFEFANIYRGDNVSLCEICLKPATSHKLNKEPERLTHRAEAKPQDSKPSKFATFKALVDGELREEMARILRCDVIKQIDSDRIWYDFRPTGDDYTKEIVALEQLFTTHFQAAVRESHECFCNNVEFGTYAHVVNMKCPFIDRHDGWVVIDICIATEIAELWHKGIKTLASCCGHKKLRSTVSVSLNDEKTMGELGYDSFVNKHGIREFYLNSGTSLRQLKQEGK